MDYFFIKLGKGNNEASSLEGKHPTASIYFDALGKSAYEKQNKGKSQAKLFIGCGKKENRANTVMVVVHNATVWLLQPASEVEFSERRKSEEGSWHTKKTMSVKVLVKVPSKEVPPVLASIACSQFHARNTFTRITHWGNKKAIDYVLQKFGKDKTRTWFPSTNEADKKIEEHWRKLDEDGNPNQTAAQLLECLGSTEVETLLAKLLEDGGCHVPAHRGGTLGDIDLFAWNDTSSPLNLDGLKIGKDKRVTLQVKTWANEHKRNNTVDYLIGFGVKKGKRTFNEDWLLNQVKQRPLVLKWLKRSLDWLPEWYLNLEQFGLNK